MATVDVKAIDEAIRKLEELKRLASDPALAPFLRTNSGNGVHLPTTQTSKTPIKGVKATVLEICRELGQFNIKDVLRAMEERHFPFEGDNPQKSIGNVLRALAKDRVITRTAEASGRTPAQYRM
jgi:hypothetical protein